MPCALATANISRGWRAHAFARTCVRYQQCNVMRVSGSFRAAWHFADIHKKQLFTNDMTTKIYREREMPCGVGLVCRTPQERSSSKDGTTMHKARIQHATRRVRLREKQWRDFCRFTGAESKRGEGEEKKKEGKKSSTLAYQSKEIGNRKTKLPPLPCDKRRRRYLTLHAHT